MITIKTELMAKEGNIDLYQLASDMDEFYYNIDWTGYMDEFDNSTEDYVDATYNGFINTPEVTIPNAIDTFEMWLESIVDNDELVDMCRSILERLYRLQADLGVLSESYSRTIPLWAKKFLNIYAKAKGKSFLSDNQVDYKSIAWDKVNWNDVDPANAPSDLFNVNSDKYYIIDSHHKEAEDMEIIFAPQFGCFWSKDTGLEESPFNGEVGEGDSHTDDMLKLIMDSVVITDIGYITENDLGE